MTVNSAQEMTNEQDGSHLCTSLLGPTEGEPHDWQPDVGTGGIRPDSRIRRSVGMGVSRRRVTAYQESLVSLAQLRQRMPELNKKSQSVESELQSLETAAVDQARYLQLAESLDGFRIKLRARAMTLDVGERQQILRLLVK